MVARRELESGVAHVIAGVELGAVLAEELDSFAPAVVRGVVKRRVARRLHLVDVVALFDQFLDEIYVAVEDSAVDAHLANQASAAHGTAAVLLDADAAVLFGEGALDAAVPGVTFDHLR